MKGAARATGKRCPGVPASRRLLYTAAALLLLASLVYLSLPPPRHGAHAALSALLAGFRVQALALADAAPDAAPRPARYLVRGGGGGAAAASFWHDVPLDADALARAAALPMVVEIPAGTAAKNEILLRSPWTPIVQDVKRGAPRSYFRPSVLHYGAVPRTYEHPRLAAEGGLRGDGDPLDIVDVSTMVRDGGAARGRRYSVRARALFLLSPLATARRALCPPRRSLLRWATSTGCA